VSSVRSGIDVIGTWDSATGELREGGVDTNTPEQRRRVSVGAEDVTVKDTGRIKQYGGGTYAGEMRVGAAPLGRRAIMARTDLP